MRFRKEDKVEVMNKDEAVTLWRCGEIISGNGHTYSVRYDCYSGLKREEFVERVPRKVIRPCPPHAEGSERWMVGDIVEVFDDQSWKTASILKVNGGDYYLVRILGSCQEFRVHKLNIRIRLSWESDEWVVIGKLSGNCGDLKSSKLSTSNCYKKTSFQAPHANAKMNLQKGEICLAVQKKGGLQESQMVSSRMLKRASPYCSSILEAYTGNVKKTRAIEGEGWDRRVGPTPLLEKVDAVAYPRENLGEKYMHAKNMSNGYYELERERSSAPNDHDSDACSVGSCSVINNYNPNKFSSHFVAAHCRETNTLCSDAESYHGTRDEEENCSIPPKEEVAKSIHRLELHAYRCTIEALYASGPLTWEKESLLTNLRISLHISNDEHLSEGQSWRHASLCFQSCKDDAGICHLPLGTNSGTISAFTFDQIRQPMISLFNLVFGPSFALSKFENAPMI